MIELPWSGRVSHDGGNGAAAGPVRRIRLGHCGIGPINFRNGAPIAFQQIDQFTKRSRAQAFFQNLVNGGYNKLRIVAHRFTLLGQQDNRASAVGRIGLQFKQALFTDLSDRAVHRLSCQAKAAGNFGWSDHVLDHMDHDHGFWTRECRPAARLHRPLQPFVEPLKSLQKRDNEISGPFSNHDLVLGGDLLVSQERGLMPIYSADCNLQLIDRPFVGCSSLKGSVYAPAH